MVAALAATVAARHVPARADATVGRVPVGAWLAAYLVVGVGMGWVAACAWFFHRAWWPR